ncbi:MAG: LysM peptidoglycan-binding domain-containing protein [Phycisphaerae bacterium]|nr:LysM peptidoglycan-binding domain-containing protein [Phycisphaerae bacterium]
MQRDFKIGMVLGLVLVAVVVVLLSTQPGLSIQARMQSPDSAVHRKMGISPLANSIKPRKENTIRVNNKPSKDVKTERIHIVSNGETLSDISCKYYGSADKWQKILGADRFPVKDPDKLRPGTRLIIPE